MVQALHKFSLFGLAGNGWISGGIQDHLGLFKRRQLMKVAQKLKEPDVPRQVALADTAKHAQVGLPTICQPQFVKFLPHLYDRLTMNPARIVADTLT